jgi:uncharacterized protein with HEPN domain
MQRDLCAYLHDVLAAADAISNFVADLNYDAFGSADLLQSGVKHKLEIIGEALKQASRYFPGSLDSVTEAKFAIGLRDRIAHGYFSVDPQIIWDTIQNDLPLLVKQVQQVKSALCT